MPALQILTNLDTERPQIPREHLVDAACSTIGRLPGGMASGKSSVAIYAALRQPLHLADGRTITHVFCETSLDHFNVAQAAFQGAEARDEEERQRIIRNG